MDVHKETIAVAIADEGRGEVRSYGTIKNRLEAVAKLIKKLGPAERLACCYEAGPCGYGLQRQLVGLGASCIVVAPSLIPTRPGDRIKTDRRDALKLARLLRSGELTSIWVPDAEHEALRDLSRAREAARDARHRARQQLGKLLLRLGIEEPSETKRWSQRYREWLGEVKLEQPLQQVVLADAIETVDAGTARFVAKVRWAHGQTSLSEQFRQQERLDGKWTVWGLARAVGVDRDWIYRRIARGTLHTERHPTTGHHLIPDDPTLLATLQAEAAAGRRRRGTAEATR